MKKKIIYISELSIPSNTASPIQIFKMCDAFSILKYRVDLIVQNNDKQFGYYKRKYKIRKNFKLISYSTKKQNINFFHRVCYSMFIIKNLKNFKKNIIYARSFLVSTLLSFLKIKTYIEIHQEPKGFTNAFFLIKKLLIGQKYQKFIFIHKNLNRYFSIDKRNFIVKDDAVCFEDFNIRPRKKLKNECLYTGGLYQGKGLEIISKIASRLPNHKFIIYGEKTKAENNVLKNIPRNISIKKFVDYRKIPYLLKNHKILLMPYSQKISINARNSDVSEYISPLKLYEYLASGNIIIASRLKVYEHILKHNFNAFLIDPENISGWCNAINKTLKNFNNLKKMRQNAILTAKKHTWNSRAKSIIKFIEKN